ncbi:hypothetical protein [Microvirga splendida]|uniref:Uncharacterized protein n=1 Tax=Microvirga splendida TaxID=2795727 RepID=A0ABS0Y5D9_9HYPH|nr:hypothetical protein [Microvirga splendida]MBJ6127525.1 hypothetical protein [Microvirga splendida]
MPDHKMLSGELGLWSAVLLGQGEKDWAELLDRAAAKLAQDEQDEVTASSLRLYAVVVGQNNQPSFQALLKKAADALN